jgi:hypothetical protein
VASQLMASRVALSSIELVVYEVFVFHSMLYFMSMVSLMVPYVSCVQYLVTISIITSTIFAGLQTTRIV